MRFIDLMLDSRNGNIARLEPCFSTIGRAQNDALSPNRPSGVSVDEAHVGQLGIVLPSDRQTFGGNRVIGQHASAGQTENGNNTRKQNCEHRDVIFQHWSSVTQHDACREIEQESVSWNRLHPNGSLPRGSGQT